MKAYILINIEIPDDPILGVYDCELLALKRQTYFKSVYPDDELKIVEKNIEYIDRE